ncbi:AraC family transcriptional regulator [Lachnospiraceae bacterium 42-17]
MSKKAENNTLVRNPAYRETKHHTDAMFAFNVYPCTIPTDFTFVPLHWHDSMEIIYVKRGNGVVQVDFHTYTADAGEIFLVQPGHLHGLRSIFKKRMEYENIIFDMSFLGSESVDLCSQKYLLPIESGKIQLPTHIGKNHELYPSISACLNTTDNLCALRTGGYELGVKGQLMTLFSLLLQIADQQKVPSPDSVSYKNVEKLKSVLSRIELNYDKKLSINDIAGECGYSASHFMRWFKEVTGSGFLGYLIEYRLNRAASALRDTNDTILDIAERNGFENLSNFNRLFKKKFEMTPSQFRRNWSGTGYF